METVAGGRWAAARRSAERWLKGVRWPLEAPGGVPGDGSKGQTPMARQRRLKGGGLKAGRRQLLEGQVASGRQLEGLGLRD
jgi:hypothetical protein